MIGAVYTHATAGENMKILHNAVLIIFALAILWLDKKVT
jgi:hypothetical protein